MFVNEVFFSVYANSIYHCDKCKTNSIFNIYKNI